MNFEIQKRTLSRVIRDDLDALIVFWPSQQVAKSAEKDPVSILVQQAVQKGDFELKAGSVLTTYGQVGTKARHVVVVCTGENQSSQTRSAVTAAWAALKTAKVKHLGIHAVGEWSVNTLQTAAAALADASYAYTTTLSQPKPRVLKQVTFSATEVSAEHKTAVTKAQALMAGVELAKEWANRPANHATLSLIHI